MSKLSAFRLERRLLSFFFSFLFLRFLLPLTIELFVSIWILWCFHFVFLFFPLFYFSPSVR